MTIVEERRAITGGVDTHSEVHVAAAPDPVGGLPGTRDFPATSAGHASLLGWLDGFGEVTLIGVEGTGSYRAGLSRHLGKHGVRVVEVDRADRQDRRRNGKPRPAGRGQRRPCGPVRPGGGRAKGAGRGGGGDPDPYGRQAQRPPRADLSRQPGPRPDPDRP
ncbi:MAG TPA: transposase [Streptosporangiaceae bacterium]|nr:transposase [Streptosporangiaceae bacterium]